MPEFVRLALRSRMQELDWYKAQLEAAGDQSLAATERRARETPLFTAKMRRLDQERAETQSAYDGLVTDERNKEAICEALRSKIRHTGEDYGCGSETASLYSS